MSEVTHGIEEAEGSGDDLVRAKGILDGATTLPEAIVKAHEFAMYLQGLHDQGYVLSGTVEDDYAFLSKTEG